MPTLPDAVWQYIFSFLQSKLVCRLGVLCKQFYRVSRDQLLWKFFLGRDYQIHEATLNEVSLSHSCISEYVHLRDCSPCVVSQVIRKHKDEVLHVAFSHDGKMFCTCSKDACVKVWEVSARATLLFDRDMSDFHWKSTQFSQFNSSDTMLLVSGEDTDEDLNSGDIVIFSLDDFSILSCQSIEPYDTYGCWYDDSLYLSAESFWAGIDTSCSTIYISRATQMGFGLIFRFKSENASSVHMLMVADVPILSENPASHSITQADRPPCSAKRLKFDAQQSQLTQKYLVFTCGVRVHLPHAIGIKKIDGDLVAKSLSPEGIDLPVYNGHDEILYDTLDHLIDVEGPIIGTSLSADQRYLYVSLRAWVKDYEIVDSQFAPSMSHDIEVRCYDLCTLSLVPNKCFKSQRECTGQYMVPDGPFFISLDTSPDYLATGAEDNNAYLWDNQLGCRITRLGHKSAVNAVAFNPMDQETLVTVSDDHLIRIWHSRRRQRELQNLKRSAKRKRSLNRNC